MIVPLVYRIYCSTTQRVTASVRNLNSHGAFIIVIEEEKQIIIWIGSLCSEDDSDLANNIAETIVKRDFKDMDDNSISTVQEGEETGDILEPMLDLFFTTVNQYYSKISAAERRKKIINSSVSVGLIEPIPHSIDTFEFLETAFAHPDTKGIVPRLTFVPIEMNTIAYINIGDYWDIWCARAVSVCDIEKVMIFIRNNVATQLNLIDNETTKRTNILGQYVHLYRQGEETTLFKRPLKIFTDFEPAGKTAPRPDPAPKMKKTIDQKAVYRLLSNDNNTNENERYNEKKAEEEDEKTLISARSSVHYNENNNEDEKSQSPSEASYVHDNNIIQSNHSHVDFYNHSSIPNRKTLSVASNDSLTSNNVTYPLIHMEVVIHDYNKAYGIEPQCVDAEMLRVVDSACLNPTQRLAVIDEAARNPRSLIGYQVEIDDGVYAGVFIVTEIKKSFLYKTMFHLCALDKDEFWVRLRRNKKQGVTFRPLRRIVEVQFIEPSSNNNNNNSSSDNHTNTVMINTTGTSNTHNHNPTADTITTARDSTSNNNIAAAEEDNAPASFPSIGPQFSLQLNDNSNSDEEEKEE